MTDCLYLMIYVRVARLATAIALSRSVNASKLMQLSPHQFYCFIDGSLAQQDSNQSTKDESVINIEGPFTTHSQCISTNTELVDIYNYNGLVNIHDQLHIITCNKTNKRRRYYKRSVLKKDYNK
jgi:hypothetical protein